NRRYATANGLAADIGRFLENQPVEARPPSNVYRLQKLMRRNRLAFASATAVVLALTAGLAVAVWESVKEHQQRQLALRAEKQAKDEAARCAQASGFLKDVLKGADPAVALGKDTALLHEILDRVSGRLGVELKGQPLVEAELRYTIGNTYYALADYTNAESMHR